MIYHILVKDQGRLAFYITHTDDGEGEDGGGTEEHVAEDPEQAGGGGEGPAAPHLHITISIPVAVGWSSLLAPLLNIFEVVGINSLEISNFWLCYLLG